MDANPTHFVSKTATLNLKLAEAVGNRMVIVHTNWIDACGNEG
jgi:hypothetical protein